MALPALAHLGDRRRLLVVGAPGIGKSSAVRDWLAGESVTWATTDLPRSPVETPWLVVDDLPGLDRARAHALGARLDRLPAATRVVLISRRPWPSRPCADAVRLDAQDLLLSEPRVVQILADGYGIRDAGLAVEVHERTGGWPSLVHLAGRHLNAGSLASLGAPGTEMDSFVAGHVLRHLSGPGRRLLRHLSVLDPVCDDLLGPRDRHALRMLAQTGLAVPTTAPAGAPAARWLRAVPVVAALVGQRWPLTEPARRQVQSGAAAWYTAKRL